jgi:hypothetical protein
MSDQPLLPLLLPLLLLLLPLLLLLLPLLLLLLLLQWVILVTSPLATPLVRPSGRAGLCGLRPTSS